MPISKYYGGHGEKVLAEMIARYGKKKGTQVFYATANKEDHKEKLARKHAK